MPAPEELSLSISCFLLCCSASSLFSTNIFEILDCLNFPASVSRARSVSPTRFRLLLVFQWGGSRSGPWSSRLLGWKGINFSRSRSRSSVLRRCLRSPAWFYSQSGGGSSVSTGSWVVFHSSTGTWLFGPLRRRSGPAPFSQWLGELCLCHLTLETSLELKHAGWMVLSFHRVVCVWLDVISACFMVDPDGRLWPSETSCLAASSRSSSSRLPSSFTRGLRRRLSRRVVSLVLIWSMVWLAQT